MALRLGACAAVVCGLSIGPGPFIGRETSPYQRGGQDEGREGQGRNEHSFRLCALGLGMRLGVAGGVCVCGRYRQAAAAAAAVWTANAVRAVRGACAEWDAGV